MTKVVRKKREKKADRAPSGEAAASLGMADFKQWRQYAVQGAMWGNNGGHSAAQGQKFGCD